MKAWKLALTSFVIGTVLSIAPIAAYACADFLYVQDQADCHLYTRYVLTSASTEDGVETCVYEDCGGSLHREDDCSGGYIL